MEIKKSSDGCGKWFVKKRPEYLGDHKDIFCLINKIKKSSYFRALTKKIEKNCLRRMRISAEQTIPLVRYSLI